MTVTPTMTPSEQAAWAEMARSGELYKYARVHAPKVNENQQRWLREYHVRLSELARRYRDD